MEISKLSIKVSNFTLPFGSFGSWQAASQHLRNALRAWPGFAFSYRCGKDKIEFIRCTSPSFASLLASTCGVDPRYCVSGRILGESGCWWLGAILPMTMEEVGWGCLAGGEVC